MTPLDDEMSDDEMSDDEQELEQEEAMQGTMHGTRPPEDNNSSQDTAIWEGSDSEDGDEVECPPELSECPCCRGCVLWTS